MNKHKARYLGQVFTRNSKGRRYTHAVIARPSESYHRAQCDAPYTQVAAKNNWLYFSEDHHHRNGLTFGAYDDGPVKTLGHEFGSAAEFLATFPTVEGYILARIDDNIQRHEKRRADGDFDRYHCMGWCGRRDLAEKLLIKETNKGCWAEVRIVETEIN